MSITDTEPFSLTRVIGNAQALIKRAPALFIGVTALFVLLPQVLGGVVITFNSDAGNLVNIPLAIVALFGKAILTWAALQMLNGRTVSFGEAAARGSKYFWGVFGIGLLTNIGIAVGLVLLIVPGLFLMTIWAVALPAYIARENGVSTALTESAELTKGSRWPIFGVLILVWVVYWAAIAVSIGLSYVSTQATAIGDIALVPLFLSAVELVLGVGLSALYHELRYRGRGAVDQTAEVFA